jgi:hypothetical protein
MRAAPRGATATAARALSADGREMIGHRRAAAQRSRQSRAARRSRAAVVASRQRGHPRCTRNAATC